MAPPTIDSVTYSDFGCLQSVTLRPGRIHALIGPNDSGKSTALRGIMLASLLAQKRIHRDVLRQRYGGGGQVTVATAQGEIQVRNEGLLSSPRRELVPSAALLRLEPDELRKPSALIPREALLGFASEGGAGLPGVYDAILTRDPRAFLGLEERLRKLFPSVKGLSLDNINEGFKALSITLASGVRVPAERMSEGLLYYLAFAALEHLDEIDVLLVEEPENGLHPSRISDVMGVLKTISERAQVILATHSPLVINELKGEEVTVLTRSESGVKATVLSKTPNYEERSKVYAPGELWLSYADGDQERDLLEGPGAAP